MRRSAGSRRPARHRKKKNRPMARIQETGLHRQVHQMIRRRLRKRNRRGEWGKDRASTCPERRCRSEVRHKVGARQWGHGERDRSPGHVDGRHGDRRAALFELPLRRIGRTFRAEGLVENDLSFVERRSDRQ